MQKAFGVVLEQNTIDGVEYRVREGSIHLPASLQARTDRASDPKNNRICTPERPRFRSMTKVCARN
jgi:hypothetical protein